MPNLEWYLNYLADFQPNIDSEAEIVQRYNNSGSAINKGAPCCLDQTVTTSPNRGLYATIPNASNLALFEGVWLGTPINGALSNIPIAQYGLVQRRGWVLDDQQVGAARVLGHANISAIGKFLMYTAGNDYFQTFSDLYSDLEEQASKILSGEAYTTAVTALKTIWLKG